MTNVTRERARRCADGWHRSAGWRVSLSRNGKNIRAWFADKKHGGEIPARQAAAAWRAEALTKLTQGNTDKLRVRRYYTRGAHPFRTRKEAA